MKKHKYLFVACLSLFPIMVVAENDTRNEIAEVWAAANINKNRLYKGKVVDEKTSEPLVGATVKVKGSTIGTITDIDGNFKLDVPANISPIVFEVSYMGYASKEATPHKTEGFTIRLAEDSQVLEEVQIIAYGKQSKMSVTAAISSISNKDLLRSPSGSVFYGSVRCTRRQWSCVGYYSARNRRKTENIIELFIRSDTSFAQPERSGQLYVCHSV
mgnify:CR=1 FL=1